MKRAEAKAAALYPVGEKQPERVRTRRGNRLDDFTLKNVLSGALQAGDLAIAKETLALQAEVAQAAERATLAANLLRGAELSEVPQETIFATYELLRPGRARSKEELMALAARYRRDYGAPAIAALIEEAAEVYARRNLYRRRF